MKGALIVALALFLTAPGLAAQSPAAAPAPVAREFRAAWLVTVGNGDWPSRPGLSTWDQQQELLALLNEAVQLRLNAVIFHVRTGACRAASACIVWRRAIRWPTSTSQP